MKHIKFSIVILSLLAFLCSNAQDIRDSLQGEYIGTRTHYKFGGIQEYSGPDTLYVYKATVAGKIHIRYEPYATEQEYLDFEISYPQNLYDLESDSSFLSQNYTFHQSGFFSHNHIIYLRDYLRNGGGVSDQFNCEKNKNITIGISDYHINKVFIYPNPTQNILNITGSYRGKIDLYNTIGKVVLVTINAKTIDLSKLPKGVYYLSLNKVIHSIVKL